MIEVWSEPACTDADGHMPQAILTRLHGHITMHPWWQARARLVARLIRDQMVQNPPLEIIDVGCGWGVTLSYLEGLGHRVTGLDVGLDALGLLDRPNRNLVLGDIQNGPIPDSAKGRFDVVLALDVLEHLDDDRAALDHLLQLVRPGGMVIITVPAQPELWSEFDEIQGHRRRYTKKQVSELMAQNGNLSQIQVHYCWPWLVWPARFTRTGMTSGNQALTQEPWQVYESYVRPSVAPVRWILSSLFALTENAIIKGKNRSGTSILTFGFRKPVSLSKCDTLK